MIDLSEHTFPKEHV